MSQEINYQQAQRELLSILDLLRWTATQLGAHELYFGHGADNPWDEALMLILPSLQLPLDSPEKLFDARLTTDERSRLLALVHKRIEQRIPTAYLTQQAWFCGQPFYVDERVLVPRSPFAQLIQQHFEPWLQSPPTHILDMCTGSGCIAIAAAQAFELAQVDAVDISTDALAVAERNIHDYGLEDRVFALASDLFGSLQGHQYDLIICNPPYVDAEDMADLPQEYRHEPELGLAAGNDGLDLVEQILRDAPFFLQDNGWLFVEVGNSLVHMAERFPGLQVEWVALEGGSQGIFAVNKAQLQEFNHVR